MTALEIVMAGYLAFGQPTGNYYEAITKHSGLQVIHADGAVTLRLREEGRGKREENGAETTVIRLRDERYPFEVTRYVRTWDDCAAVETWAEIRHEERGAVKLLRADSFAAPVAVKSETVRVMSLTGIAKNEANVSETALPMRELETPYGVVKIIPPELALVERILIANYPPSVELAATARKMMVAAVNDSRFDWVEAERLAALSDFGVLAELRALREDVSNG